MEERIGVSDDELALLKDALHELVSGEPVSEAAAFRAQSCRNLCARGLLQQVGVRRPSRRGASARYVLTQQGWAFLKAVRAREPHGAHGGALRGMMRSS